MFFTGDVEIELDGMVSKQIYSKTKYLDPLETALKMENSSRKRKKLIYLCAFLT